MKAKLFFLILGLAILSSCSHSMLMKNCDPIIEAKYLYADEVYEPAPDNSDQDYRCYTKMPWE